MRTIHARTGLRFFFVLCLLALSGMPAHAVAQSPEQLKAENAKLTEQVRELRAELEKAQRNIRVLSDEIKRLRTTRSTGGSPSKPETTPSKPNAPEPTPVAIPDDPFASPRAYIQNLRTSYNDTFEEIDPEDGNAKSLRIAEVRTWAGGSRRQLRGPIDWMVRLDTSDGPGVTAREATFRYFHVPTGQLLGDPFTIRMGRADLRRLNDADPDTVYRLRGLLSARIKPSYERATPEGEGEGEGVFVGAYAELFMDIRVDSLRPQ